MGDRTWRNTHTCPVYVASKHTAPWLYASTNEGFICTHIDTWLCVYRYTQASFMVATYIYTHNLRRSSFAQQEDNLLCTSSP